jgi:hypothetical protein
MGCGCGGGKKLGGGVRGAGHRPVSTPRRGSLTVPRGISPTERRALVTTDQVSSFSAQRREIERKRRLAIQRALNK